MNGKLTKDEIKTFSAALISVEATREDWAMRGQNMILTMDVKTVVDRDKLIAEMKKILADKPAKNQIKKQQRQIADLEKKLANIQKMLVESDYDSSVKLRKKRNTVFTEISELDKKKIDILTRIENESKDALRLIEIGMTDKDVYELLGKPAKHCAYGHWYVYGRYIVKLDNGIVTCILSISCPDGFHSPCSYHKEYNRQYVYK